MICVLSKFSDNKLVLNHLSNFWSISLVMMLKSLAFWLVIKTLVSSANSTGVAILFKNKGKSFMYTKKSKGPNIDP
jgi:hypothetical protein